MNLFNTPTETGLRCLILLSVQRNTEYDLDRLTYLDYFLLYPSDSPSNRNNDLHVKTPYRASELAIKRSMLSEGLLLMIKKGLIEIMYKDTGVYYITTSVAKPFLDYFKSQYYQNLLKNAQLIVSELSDYSLQDLKEYTNSHIGTWGVEFTRESLFRIEQND